MDPEPLTFGYGLAGCVNGAQASLWIEGTVGHGEVRFETTVRSPEEPLLWDGQVLALAAIDPVVLLSLDFEAPRRGTAPETFRVESGIYDEGDKPAGRFVLLGCWSMEDHRIELRAQFVEGWLNFEPMERVTHVGETSSMSMLHPGDGKVVATGTWSFETSRGNNYSGTSVCRGYHPTPSPVIRDRILSVRWSASPGNAGGEDLSCQIQVQDAQDINGSRR